MDILVEVREDGQLEIREEREDGYHRYVREPGDDVSGDPFEVRKAAQKYWTQAAIEAYREAHKPPVLPPEFDFAGRKVANAEQVERVTTSRIQALIASGKSADVARSLEIRLLGRAVFLLDKIVRGQATDEDRTQMQQLRQLWIQIEQIQSEGQAFIRDKFER